MTSALDEIINGLEIKEKAKNQSWNPKTKFEIYMAFLGFHSF